ncbi:MAG: SCP2 sterol-binding domain-containing protein, partial [Planctomycetes bacterium]|nr:SCP2 sterol-binding domain-containing protein [Planctomycetota bacterium]
AGKIKASNLGDMMKFGSAFDMKKAKQLAEQHSKPAAAASAPAPAGPQELVTRAFTRLPETFRPEKAGGWSACVQFHLEGGEDWTVEVKDGQATTAPGRKGTATCVVATSLEDYAQILAGELKAEQAFVQGRIKPSNIGELMKFGSAFDLRRVAELIREPGGEAEPAGGLNRDLLGHVRRAREPQWVRPEHALAFAKATQDENPAYEGEGAMAPPMFSVRLFKDLLFDLVSDPELGADVLRLVHGEQDMEFLRPLHPWDLCALRAEITGMERKSSGELLRLEERLYVGGELAVRIGASMFIRGEGGAKSKGAKEAPPPAASAPPPPLFSEQITVAPNQSLVYADASLDNNPIHTDAEVAKLAGFPGVILQGLCTMSFAAKALVDHLGGRDPARLKRLGVRFSKPVLSGDVLTVSAWELDALEGRKVYGVSVVNQAGVEVIQNGRAELAV